MDAVPIQVPHDHRLAQLIPGCPNPVLWLSAPNIKSNTFAMVNIDQTWKESESSVSTRSAPKDSGSAALYGHFVSKLFQCKINRHRS